MRVRSQGGFTLTEILITVVLIGVVFMGAISLYTTGLKFLAARQAVDITLTPDIAIEQMMRYVNVANQATLSQGGTQLNLRVDYDLCSNTRAVPTPGNVADDNYWHYRLLGGQLLRVCDNNPVTAITAVGNPAGTVVHLPNLDTAASTLQMTNPSSSGNATVVAIHIVSTSPAMTVDTEVALGAAAKR